MGVFRIFDEQFRALIIDNVKNVLLEGSEDVEEPVEREEWKSATTSFKCSYCCVNFEDLAQLREHYKLDWHRYNLRLSLLSKASITEEQFTEKTLKDDISSISGSDSEKEDSVDTYATAQGKIFLQSQNGKVFSLYASLLCNKKEDLTDETVSSRLQACCVKNKKWTVLMLGGGHFAGAVFDGGEPVAHKTFHCYTVRAGQGGSQSSRDNKSGGSHPKSAGASLRRYNEQALVQHIRSIVEKWKEQIAQSSLIIYRASGPYNRSVLFGGNPPLLDRMDPRLRTIPFSTRRATFAEVRRVQSLLSLAQIYESFESAVEHFSQHKNAEQPSKRNKTRSPHVDRSKSREIVERPLPVNLSDTDESSDENSVELFTETENISFGDSLQEFEDTLTPEQRKPKTHKKKYHKKSKAKRQKEEDNKRKSEIIDVLSRGDVEKLEMLFKGSSCDEVDEAKSVKELFFNEVLDEEGNTLLHVSALNEQADILLYLLKNGANPCLKNQRQLTAYTCTQSKEIRESLKQFARENPDKYNYNKANIPTNALTPEEFEERKKAQRKIKREKEKVKKVEDKVKRQEEMDKERFLHLSDREKRALAAERRILSQSGTVTARCFHCAGDISGRVPFEYSGNRFCTVNCLKEHRTQNL